jgi:hypothetical protein
MDWYRHGKGVVEERSSNVSTPPPTHPTMSGTTRGKSAPSK